MENFLGTFGLDSGSINSVSDKLVLNLNPCKKSEDDWPKSRMGFTMGLKSSWISYDGYVSKKPNSHFRGQTIMMEVDFRYGLNGSAES